MSPSWGWLPQGEHELARGCDRRGQREGWGHPAWVLLARVKCLKFPLRSMALLRDIVPPRGFVPTLLACPGRAVTWRSMCRGYYPALKFPLADGVRLICGLTKRRTWR